MTPVDPLARRKIQAVVEDALAATGIAGTFPTPLEPLREYAGIRERVDMSDLPEEFVAKKPPKWKSILGAYVLGTERSFVDLSQTAERVLFTDAHETSHALIPWHEDTYYLDDDGRLYREVKEELEAQANLGAALIIFQNGRFHERALAYQRTIDTPILLAGEFGASCHAAIRHYVEYHPARLRSRSAGAIAATATCRSGPASSRRGSARSTARSRSCCPFCRSATARPSPSSSSKRRRARRARRRAACASATSAAS
jgi:hypothetical protein